MMRKVAEERSAGNEFSFLSSQLHIYPLLKSVWVYIVPTSRIADGV